MATWIQHWMSLCSSFPQANHSGHPRLASRRYLAALWPQSHSSGPCSLDQLQDTGAWGRMPEPCWAEQAPMIQN